MTLDDLARLFDVAIRLADVIGTVHRNRDAFASLFTNAGALWNRVKLRFRGTIYPMPEEDF